MCPTIRFFICSIKNLEMYYTKLFQFSFDYILITILLLLKELLQLPNKNKVSSPELIWRYHVVLPSVSNVY